MFIGEIVTQRASRKDRRTRPGSGGDNLLPPGTQELQRDQNLTGKRFYKSDEPGWGYQHVEVEARVGPFPILPAKHKPIPKLSHLLTSPI